MELHKIQMKTSKTSIKKSSNKKQSQINYCQNDNSPKVITVQENQFDDDDDDNSFFENMSLEDLNKKVQMYNSLFRANKINKFNAFQIDLISCVQQIVKKEKKTNFVDIGITFDAISKVYTCRVDDVLASGNKLVKEFIMETKNKQNKVALKKQEIDKMKPARKKIMLTTADKLRHKDNQMLPKQKFSNFLLENNIIDYAKPSRILINSYYSNKPYWPEYKLDECTEEINVIQNPLVKYEMENLTHLIKKCKMCPYFNQFVAECDKSTNDNYQNKLDSITTHFSPETSKFNDSNNHHSVDSYESHESMDIDINESNSEIIVDEDFLSYHKSLSNQDNSDSISQILSIVDSQNKNDYTFFNKNKLHNFQCPDHWKDKFKLMSITHGKRSKTHVSSNHDSDSQTNISMKKSKRIACTQFTVNFSSDLKKKLKDLKHAIGMHKCDTDVWKPCITPPSELHNSPIRKLEHCNYINMVPDWYRNEFTKSNLTTTENSLFLFSAHDGFEEHSSLNDIIVPKKSEENVDNDDIMITDSLDESTKKKTDLNDENYSVIVNDYNDIQDIDDTFQELELPNFFHKSINMYELKKCIISVIKPGGKNVINITFRDLLQRLPQSLPESMVENVNVAIIFVALLHLCNEHILNLKDDDNEIYISQG